MTNTWNAPLTATDIDSLAARVSGQVMRPGDHDYEQLRHVFNAMIDRHPAAIVRCLDTTDVQQAVSFARKHRVQASVRGGGHSVQGYGVCDGGLVIDLSLLNRVAVDPGKRTATAEGGATWGVFDAATQAHGLAVTGGRISSTGVVGLTLGSGSGWLERHLGYTVDSMLGADVVLADGSLIHTSATENEDLFWGLRGGGGNFGIVTQIEFQLHPVGPLVYGGILAYPRERSAEVLKAYRDFMESAPPEVGGVAALICAPPAPFVPVELHFKPVTGIVVCYSGDPADGPHVCKPLLDLNPALAMVEPMPYTAVQTLLDPANPPGMQNYWKAEFLADLDDDTIDAFAAAAAQPPSPMTTLIVQPLGGTIANISDSATAMGWRSAKWVLHLLGMWPDPAENSSQIAWIRALDATVAAKGLKASYLNYLMDEGEQKVIDAFGESYGRMVQLKNRYDPTNFFNMNQNIKPTV